MTGSVSEYIGDKQLSAISVTVLEGSKDVVITDVTTKEANDYETNFGKLVRVEGEVIDYTLAGGIVESITVQDDSGESCRVFIDGYIGYSDETSQALEDFVAEGAYISAVGFVSHDAEGNRLRIRDRSEILPAEPGEEPAPENYEVTVSVANGSFEGAETAAEGQDYTGKIVAADGYQLPEQITVTVAGQELSAGDYAYDAQTGELTIPGAAVTGNIEITASCTEISGEEPGEEQPGGGTDQPGSGTDQPGGDGQTGGNNQPGSDTQQPGGDSQNAGRPGGNAQTGATGTQQNGNTDKNTDSAASTVKTGDTSCIMVWAVLLVIAAAAAGTTAVVAVRRRRR